MHLAHELHLSLVCQVLARARVRAVVQPGEPLGFEAPDPVVELALAERELSGGLGHRGAQRQVAQCQQPAVHRAVALVARCRLGLLRAPASCHSHYVA